MKAGPLTRSPSFGYQHYVRSWLVPFWCTLVLCIFYFATGASRFIRYFTSKGRVYFHWVITWSKFLKHAFSSGKRFLYILLFKNYIDTSVTVSCYVFSRKYRYGGFYVYDQLVHNKNHIICADGRESIVEGLKRKYTTEVRGDSVCSSTNVVNSFHTHRGKLVEITRAANIWYTTHGASHNSRIKLGFNLHILLRSRGDCTITSSTEKLRSA